MKKELTLITQFTLYMLVPIALMSTAGYFLDKHFGTSWIFIVCFFVGAIAGGQNVYRLAMKIAREKKKEPEENIINRRSDKTQSQKPKEKAGSEKSDD